MKTDLIIGVHSVVHALRNSERQVIACYATEDGVKALQREGVSLAQVTRLDHKEFFQKSQEVFKEHDYNYQRPPSGVFLIASQQEELSVEWLYQNMIERDRFKLLCLDQVTDIHNFAAVVRTAAFFGVDAILVAQKSSPNLTPGFFRIASGGAEYLPLVRCSSLPKTVAKLKKMGIPCVGFSEHAKNEAIVNEELPKSCLVMGAEDVGISNALLRILDHIVAFKPAGEIQSLNVSVASALAMEKFWGKN